MAKEVSFLIKIDDRGTVKRVTADAEELGKVIRTVQDEAEILKSRVFTWSQAAQAADTLHNAVSQLHNVMGELAASSQVQLVAETQLTTIMRQRMDATDEEIMSIKELCAAQQELGVIGDEVQLSGAQQMATFLGEKQSLEALVPAMNNLLAQQKGMNATTQDAVSIGNMMGKAMQGQVDVLQRVGITFDENQKKVLQYGTESERAAMLAEVITQNVGEMNAELAKTDAGKQKQLENTLGDIKEQLGGIVQSAMPLVTVAAQLSLCATSGIQLVSAVRSVSAAFGVQSARAVFLATHTKVVATAQKLLAASGYSAAAGTTALRIAVAALYATMTMGLTLVITAVIGLFTKLGKTAEEAAGGLEDSAEAVDTVKEAYDGTLKSTLDDLNKRYAALKTQWKSLSTEQQKVAWIRQNRSELEELRLKINGVADAENIFGKGTDAVVEAFARRARAAARTAQLTELYRKQMELMDRKTQAEGAIRADAARSGRSARKGDEITDQTYRSSRYGIVDRDGKWHFHEQGAKLYSGTDVSSSSTVRGIDNELDQVGGKIKSVLNDIAREGDGMSWISGGGRSVKGGSGTTPVNTDKPLTLKANATQLGDIENNVKYYQSLLQKANEQEAADINRNIALWQEKADKIKNAGKAVEQGPQLKADATELGDIETNISYFQAQLMHANEQEAVGINQSIALWQKKADAIREAGTATGGVKTYDGGATTLNGITDNIDVLNSQLGNASIEEAAGINQLIALWQKKADAIRNAGAEAEKTQKTSEKLFAAWGNTKGIGDGIQSLTQALEGNKDAWSTVTAVVDSFIQIYEGVSGIISIVKALTSATQTDTAATMAQGVAKTTEATIDTTTTATEVANSAARTAASGVETTADVAGAAAKTMKAHASIPWVGIAIGAGMVASLIGIMAALPKFADGGIAYGPTLGIFGEYAGASSNPEVVAPLDRLKSLIGGGGGAQHVVVTGRLRGSDIVLSGDNTRRINRKYRQ